MSKSKISFFCSNCGTESPKWMGKCPSCGEWNTFKEETFTKTSGSSSFQNKYNKEKPTPKLINDIDSSKEKRINTNNDELNRVLGGGLVPGTVVLIGGEPGIGKSTLMLQIALNIKSKKVLYVTGEESEQQIKMRAERIQSINEDCYILTETQTNEIIKFSLAICPDILIIDSVQTLWTDRVDSVPGSITQIRESAAEILKYSKSSGVPAFIIGHITKDGVIAGPKLLEHIVDTVLQFEGDRNHIYRILRATKNRYGSTSELGIYQMSDKGLREVKNPSEVLLSEREDDVSGVAISVTIEGIRPILIEIQALVSTAVYGTPQRSSTGFDFRRLNMLLAVLEKRCGFRLAAKDVFLNITGGIKVEDPANDLAVVCSVLSSNADISVDSKKCFSAEVGLSGEIRPVSRIEQRIKEAEKLGFKQIFVSKYNLKGINLKNYNIDIIGLKQINEAYKYLFEL